MKIFAIISEYNPLHSGHLYHLNETRKYADKIVVIMSGSFTERGDIAISNKYSRAVSAIKAGADMVIELPTVYAVSPADKFAYGAIKTLSTMNIDSLSFGSECGDIVALEKAAKVLSYESKQLKAEIQIELKKGNSLIKSRANSLKSLGIEISELTPNNTLAIEYINAIHKLKSPITPFTIKRSGNGYTNEELTGKYLSATAIRKAIYNGQYDSIKGYLPFEIDYFANANNNLHKMILYKLNLMSNEDLNQIFDVTEGLENRIKKCLNSDYEVFINELKTKRYTMARLKRILIASLLGITKDFYKNSLNATPYVNVLAIKEESKDLLSMINTPNIITKPSDIKHLTLDSLPMVNLDTLSHRILSIINEDKSNLNSMQII